MSISTILIQLHQTKSTVLDVLQQRELPPVLLAGFVCDCAVRALQSIRQIGLEPDPRSINALSRYRNQLETPAPYPAHSARIDALEAFTNVARGVRSDFNLRAPLAHALKSTCHAILHQLVDASNESIRTVELVAWNLAPHQDAQQAREDARHREITWQTQHLFDLLSKYEYQRRRLFSSLIQRHQRMKQSLQQATHQWENALYR